MLGVKEVITRLPTTDFLSLHNGSPLQLLKVDELLINIYLSPRPELVFVVN